MAESPLILDRSTTMAYSVRTANLPPLPGRIHTLSRWAFFCGSACHPPQPVAQKLIIES